MKKLLAVLVLGVSMISCSTPDAPIESEVVVVNHYLKTSYNNSEMTWHETKFIYKKSPTQVLRVHKNPTTGIYYFSNPNNSDKYSEMYRIYSIATEIKWYSNNTRTDKRYIILGKSLGYPNYNHYGQHVIDLTSNADENSLNTVTVNGETGWTREVE